MEAPTARRAPFLEQSHRCITTKTSVAAAFGSTLPSPTRLEAIVNMEKMLQRTPEQIGSLWQEVSHLNVSAVLSCSGKGQS